MSDEIRANPAFELLYPLHDGWGGQEWYFAVNGKQYGSYETEGEATAEMARVINAHSTGDAK